jgi:hypothetical protein
MNQRAPQPHRNKQQIFPAFGDDEGGHTNEIPFWFQKVHSSDDTEKILLGLRKHHPVAKAARNELGENHLLQCLLPAELDRQCEDGIAKSLNFQSVPCRFSSQRSMRISAREMMA